MSTATTDTTPDVSAHTLQCMEIWGGNDPIDSGISVPGIDAWVTSQPYDGAVRGGDIHYVSICACGRISRFVLADVSGHGESVADLADRIRKLLRRYINTPDQTQLARALNHDIAELSQEGAFATAVMAAYFPPTDHLIVCTAGHPAPLWYRADEQRWELLTPDNPHNARDLSNIPLGIIDPTDYVQYAVKLAKGDLVLLYSDAAIEAADEQGNQLEQAGLLKTVEEVGVSDPPEFLGNLLEGLSRHRGGVEPRDDMTLMLLHHNASDPPRVSVGMRLRAVARMIGLIRD